MKTYVAESMRDVIRFIENPDFNPEDQIEFAGFKWDVMIDSEENSLYLAAADWAYDRPPRPMTLTITKF